MKICNVFPGFPVAHKKLQQLREKKGLKFCKVGKFPAQVLSG